MSDDADGESIRTRNWMRHAACVNYNPEWWSPQVGEAHIAQKAIRICKTECPVLRECEEYVKGFRSPIGIFAGRLFKHQRKRSSESEQAS